VLSGLAASEAALKRVDLSEVGVLHFAAHAVVDGARPERSAVLLAPGSDDEDGLLQIREIVDLDLADRVVLVTACRSASGTVLEGEGVVGLARAFFQAGARAVIGSPWPLKDDDAAALMEVFGQELTRGRGLTEAMAASRRSLIDRGAPAMAWAGLVVLGDGTHRPAAGTTPAGPRALTVAGWLCALLALLVWSSMRLWRSSPRA
jgi:CHAT domain-containing protein